MKIKQIKIKYNKKVNGKMKQKLIKLDYIKFVFIPEHTRFIPAKGCHPRNFP